MFPERVSSTLGICLLTGGSHQVVFDGRNMYDPKRKKAQGITYYGIGRAV